MKYMHWTKNYLMRPFHKIPSHIRERRIIYIIHKIASRSKVWYEIFGSFLFFIMNGGKENDSNLTARINGAMLASFKTLACLIEYC